MRQGCCSISGLAVVLASAASGYEAHAVQDGGVTLLASLLPGAPARPQAGSYESYPTAASRLAGVTLDEVWERGSCFGSPAPVVELIKSYMGRTGTTHLAVEMRIGGLEHKKVLRSMELFAKDVIPVLREEAAKLAAARGETGRY